MKLLICVLLAGIVAFVGLRFLYLEVVELGIDHEVRSSRKAKAPIFSASIEVKLRDLKLEALKGVGGGTGLSYSGFVGSIERQGKLPKLAIIIDDFGYDAQLASKFISLPYKINLAVLPFLQWSSFVSEKGHRGGKEILLHLPMQAYKHVVDRNVIRVGMNLDEIREIVERALSMVNHAVGVNNHMGSIATANADLMRKVMKVLSEKGLFFIDSYTTPDTVAYHIALEMGLPCFYNSLFIDRYSGESKVEEYIFRLLSIAKRRRLTIGIGHAKAETFNALSKLLPIVSKQVEVVFASDIVYHRGEVVKR